MAKDAHDAVDCLVWVDGGIRPCADDLSDCVTDNDDGDLTCRVIQPATEMVWLLEGVYEV